MKVNMDAVYKADLSIGRGSVINVGGLIIFSPSRKLKVNINEEK